MPGLYEIVSRKILPYNNLIAVIFVLVVFSVAGYYVYSNYNYTKYSINEKIFGAEETPDSKSKNTFDFENAKNLSATDKAILTIVGLFSSFSIIYGIYYLFTSNASTVPASADASSIAAPSSGTSSQFLSFFKLKTAKGSSNDSIAAYLLTIGIVLLTYVIYHYFYTPKYTDPKKEDPVVKTGGSFTVYFFTADWCPHCRKAKPVIDDFEKEYSKKTVNGRTIIINRIDCTDSEVEEVSKQINDFDVTSFPTVKIKDNSGNVFDFDAKITNENLTEFVNTVSNN